VLDLNLNLAWHDVFQFWLDALFVYWFILFLSLIDFGDFFIHPHWLFGGRDFCF
jgi:hypothetical protein